MGIRNPVTSREGVVALLIFASTSLNGCEPPTPGSKPNLVVSEATLDPPSFKEGDKITLTYKIKNIGDAKAEPRPGWTDSGDETSIVSHAPGSPGTSIEPGGYFGGDWLKRTWTVYNCNTRIQIHIDPGDDIDESNEDDNTWTKILDHSICQEDPAKTAFYKDCVDRINKLRNLEGLGDLLLDQSKQACSNADARVNFASIDPHAQQCGQAQNTCPALASPQKILDGCIEQQMYYQEKANYTKNPSECYNAAWPNTCGHYVNMTNKSYTKVACGMYRTPSGDFFAVMNFFK